MTLATLHNMYTVLYTDSQLVRCRSISPFPCFPFLISHFPFLLLEWPQIKWSGNKTRQVSSPDQIFRARPADSSKSRVWTLSLRKLGHVYIRRSVNWVIVVSVNYIISYQQRLLWRPKICKLAICDDPNAIYFTWAIWLVRQHADTLIWLHSSFTSVQTLFFDKAAGRARKIWCPGTRLSFPRLSRLSRPAHTGRVWEPN